MCTGRAHSDVVLNNMCEVFNRQLIDGRDKPIIMCLEYIREYLMKRIVNVKKVIEKSEGMLTPAATKLMDEVKSQASQYTVIWSGGQKYQVNACTLLVGHRFIKLCVYSLCMVVHSLSGKWPLDGTMCRRSY